MSFALGQLCVCIHPGPWWRVGGLDGQLLPEKGRVYTVRAACVRHGWVYIRLVEIVNEPICATRDGWTECWFGGDAFRPVVEDRIAVFRRLVAPSPKQKSPARVREYWSPLTST